MEELRTGVGEVIDKLATSKNMNSLLHRDVRSMENERDAIVRTVEDLENFIAAIDSSITAAFAMHTTPTADIAVAAARWAVKTMRLLQNRTVAAANAENLVASLAAADAVIAECNQRRQSIFFQKDKWFATFLVQHRREPVRRRHSELNCYSPYLTGLIIECN